jgi:hypothetical protein
LYVFDILCSLFALFVGLVEMGNVSYRVAARKTVI